MIKNVADQSISKSLISKTTGDSVTSGTTTVYVTGDHGTQNTGGGTVAHKGNGEWSYVPTQAETNYTHIAFTFVNSAAVTETVNVYTVGQDFTAARLAANVTQISGDTTAADNAEAFFDGTGYAGTNNVIPTVTAVTNGVTLSDASISLDTFDGATAFPLERRDYQNDQVARIGSAMTLAENAIDATALASSALAEIKSEVEAVLATTTRAELSGVPAANASLATKLTWLTMLARNKRTQDDTTETVFADDGITAVSTSTKVKSGGTTTRGEYV